MDFEDVLSQVGSFGKYQKLLLLFLVPVSMLSSFQSNTIFLKLTPDHWCSVPELINFSHGEQQRFIRPVLSINNSLSVLESCFMFDVDYKQVARELRLPQINETKNKLTVKSCDNGWIYDRTHYWDSAVMHYNFVCEQRDRFKAISIVRLIGCICGTPVFGFISDIYGRRIGYLSILITALISSISPLFIQEYTVFLICQFIAGLTYPSSHQIIFILMLEFMGPTHRVKVATCLWICLYLGICIHSVIIYQIPHWIYVTALNSAAVLPLILALRLIPESPQWLIAEEKYEIAKQNIENIMRINSKSIPVDLLSMQIKKIGKHKKHSFAKKVINNKFVKFLKEATLFQLWLILTLCFVINFMTEQIFELKQFEFNKEILMNQILWSLIKMPIIFMTWLMIQRRIGRRWTNSILFCMTGFSLIGLAMTSKREKTIIISLLGIMLNKASILITYLQVVELSPTKSRCLALTTSTSIATLIVALINFIYSLENFNNSFPLIVLSVISLLTGFLASFLTETLNEKMPKNISCAEDLINNTTYWRLAKRKSDMKRNFITLSKWNLNEIDELDNS